MKYIASINDKEYLVEILDEKRVQVDGVEYIVDFVSVSNQPVYSILINRQSHEAYVYPEEDFWQVLLRGTLYSVQVEDEREKRLRATAGGGLVLTGDTPIKAPMPGLIVSVLVTNGQEVKKGDTLVILESMKMQNELRAPRDGIVSRVNVKNGENVDRNQLLCYVGE